ncbi:MAG: radical SAM protein [Clostridia bacterium]|nr:radical SAM protein [Clostridia bacterium]
MKKEYIIPIFVPHLGCPHACIFCNQRKISGEQKNVRAEDVRKTIEYYLDNFKDDNKLVEVAFFGGSFTAIDIELQKELLETANEYIQKGLVNGIRISTRPDAINKNILKMLKKYNVKTIELGVQSANNYILQKAERGHTFEDVKKASKLINKYGFILGHQMMIGLPESTTIDEIDTAKALIKLKPKIVRIYPVLVIKGTKLEEEYNNGNYEPLSVVQAVERSKEVAHLFNKKKIRVIRIGLQNTDEICEPGNKTSQVVAGPYHPAFRQLVEAGMWYDVIVSRIKKLGTKVKQVQIRANPEDVNNIIGHKKENIEKLKEVYEVDVRVKLDEKIKNGKFEIIIEKTYDDIIEEKQRISIK